MTKLLALTSVVLIVALSARAAPVGTELKRAPHGDSITDVTGEGHYGGDVRRSIANPDFFANVYGGDSITSVTGENYGGDEKRAVHGDSITSVTGSGHYDPPGDEKRSVHGDSITVVTGEGHYGGDEKRSLHGDSITAVTGEGHYGGDEKRSDVNGPWFAATYGPDGRKRSEEYDPEVVWYSFGTYQSDEKRSEGEDASPL